MKKILLSLLLVFWGITPAFSQMMEPPMRAHDRGHGHMMEIGFMGRMEGEMMCVQHAHHLGLTDDQMMKITLICRDIQKKQIRLRADLKIAEIELMEIMEKKDFDLDKANAVVKKIEDLKTTQHLETVKAMKDVRAFLTEEQFKNMHKMCMSMDFKRHKNMMMKKHGVKKTNPEKPTDDSKEKKH
jgi:Spy/CpxP family protein refolding chaperone